MVLVDNGPRRQYHGLVLLLLRVFVMERFMASFGVRTALVLILLA
jgi:hypothetical protein